MWAGGDDDGVTPCLYPLFLSHSSLFLPPHLPDFICFDNVISLPPTHPFPLFFVFFWLKDIKISLCSLLCLRQNYSGTDSGLNSFRFWRLEKWRRESYWNNARLFHTLSVTPTSTISVMFQMPRSQTAVGTRGDIDSKTMSLSPTDFCPASAVKLVNQPPQPAKQWPSSEGMS